VPSLVSLWATAVTLKISALLEVETLVPPRVPECVIDDGSLMGRTSDPSAKRREDLPYLAKLEGDVITLYASYLKVR
jgi:hypothetical protein